MPRRSTVALGLAVLLGLSLAPPAAAQQPADSIRRAALEDFHGPDLEGKDGPRAKAGLDLLVLYHEYRAFRRRGGDTFRPNITGVRVQEGRVTVDAIATDAAEPLRADLEALGLTDAATAGRLVSGQLPIDSIPALATVETLRGVAPSRMRTHSDRKPSTVPPRPPSSSDTASSGSASPPTPSSDAFTPPPDSSSDTASSDTVSASAAPSEAASSPPASPSKPDSPSAPDSATAAAEAPEARDDGWGTGALLGVIAAAAGLLGLFFVLRR